MKRVIRSAWKSSWNDKFDENIAGSIIPIEVAQEIDDAGGYITQENNHTFISCSNDVNIFRLLDDADIEYSWKHDSRGDFNYKDMPGFYDIIITIDNNQ